MKRDKLGSFKAGMQAGARVVASRRINVTGLRMELKEKRARKACDASS